MVSGSDSPPMESGLDHSAALPDGVRHHERGRGSRAQRAHGRAVVVVLRGTRRLPLIVVRYDIQLADPWVPESLHPYHHELGDSGPAGGRARRRGCQAAQKASRRAVRALVGEMRSHGLEPCGAGVVVSSLS